MLASLKQEFKSLDTSSSRLREFGILVGGFLLGLQAYFFFFTQKTPIWIGVIGATLFLFGLVIPRALLWLYYVWMGIALVLGSIISRILLGVIFYIIITPIGFVVRWVKGYPLVLKNDVNAESYWRHSSSNDDRRNRFEHPF